MQQQDKMHPEDLRNLVIFFVLAVLSYIAYKHYVLDPQMARMQAAQAYVAAHPSGTAAFQPRPRDQALADSSRLRIDNGVVFGSLSLKGARIDDLSLQKYFETLDHTDHVVLLSPAGTDHPLYVESGWVSADTSLKLPGDDTVWTADAQSLGANGTVTLNWDNGAGLKFTRKLSIDQGYMIHEVDAVANTTGQPVTLSHYGLVSEHGLPADMTSKTNRTRAGRVFEGLASYLDGHENDSSFGAIIKKPMQSFTASRGWIGVSQKYWFTGLLPDGASAQTFRFVYTPSPDPETGDKARDTQRRPDKFQADVTGAPQTIAPGASFEDKTNIFAGAKEFGALQHYSRALPGSRLDLVIDWGLYWFLTKPFFYVLDFFGHLFGNLGVAIVCLTLLTRAAVFPARQHLF